MVHTSSQWSCTTLWMPPQNLDRFHHRLGQITNRIDPRPQDPPRIDPQGKLLRSIALIKIRGWQHKLIDRSLNLHKLNPNIRLDNPVLKKITLNLTLNKNETMHRDNVIIDEYFVGCVEIQT